MSGPLFPSLVSGARGPSNRHLVEFRAGKMTQKVGGTVHADKRKGLVYVQLSDDSLIHFCWKDRATGDVEDDLIIFPDDCEFKRVNKCTTGRVYVLKFKAGPKRLFFWMQEPKVDKDEDNCRKVNEYIHNPPGAPGGGGGGGGDLSALGGEGALQNFLENMRPDQLMQLISSGQGGLSALGALAGPGGLASLLGSGGPASSSSSSSSASQSSGVTPWLSTQNPTPSPAAPGAASSTTSPTGAGLTPSLPAAFPFGQTPTNTPNPPIQLSDLQNILATMNNNNNNNNNSGAYAPTAAAGSQGSPGVELTSVCTPEMMAPILCSAEVQRILQPLLPSGEYLPQSPGEIGDASSPQFQQAMGLFAVALASGQLGPLLGQFGLPPEAVDAANRGDLDAFASAVERSNKGGASKDKSDDDDDDEDSMNLD